MSRMIYRQWRSVNNDCQGPCKGSWTDSGRCLTMEPYQRRSASQLHASTSLSAECAQRILARIAFMEHRICLELSCQLRKISTSGYSGSKSERDNSGQTALLAEGAGRFGCGCHGHGACPNTQQLGMSSNGQKSSGVEFRTLPYS
jgi:hypothetical protein